MEKRLVNIVDIKNFYRVIDGSGAVVMETDPVTLEKRPKLVSEEEVNDPYNRATLVGYRYELVSESDDSDDDEPEPYWNH